MSGSDRAFALAASALVAMTALFAWILADAVALDPVRPPIYDTKPAAAELQPQDTPASEPGTKAAARQPESGAALSAEALAMMVNNDPFSPTRKPAAPYRLPGEDVVMAAPEPVREPPPPQFRVHGTVVTPSGGYALLEHENGHRIVSIGESVLGYRLASVDAQSATLEANGRLITYSLEDPPMRRPTPNTPARGRNGREEQAARERDAQRETRQEILRRALQQIRELQGDAPGEQGEFRMETVRRSAAPGFAELGRNSGTRMIRIVPVDTIRRPDGGH